jgi:hypothetical protein
MRFRRFNPQPLNPTLGTDYGSTEPLPKGWTNIALPPLRTVDGVAVLGCILVNKGLIDRADMFRLAEGSKRPNPTPWRAGS